MFRYNFVPLKAQNGTLEIALADPRNLNTIDELSLLLHKKLRSKSPPPPRSPTSSRRPSNPSASSKKSPKASRSTSSATKTTRRNPFHRPLAAGDSDIAPVIKLVDTTIFNALERRASDIHIESRDQEVVIKYRIDGVLHYAMPPIAKDWHSTIISRIKVMSELDIAERRVPQDGRFRVRYKGRLIDFRVSIMPTIHGEDAVLRVLDKESMSEKFAKLSLDVVGFSAATSKFRRYIAEPYGMVLVTGPTGSGKTTTLYAALSEIKNDEDKIITIEDPVEYQLKGITQIPVNEKKGSPSRAACAPSSATIPTRSWSAKSAIRKPRRSPSTPRSPATWSSPPSTPTTWSTCSAASSTWASRPTTSSPRSTASWRSAWCASTASTARNARPLSRFPAHRKRPDPEEWRNVEFMEGPGCFECGGTGFRGRTAIHELLDLSDRIRELILDRRPLRKSSASRAKKA
jgi:type IV pilus assembly protein PilB